MEKKPDTPKQGKEPQRSDEDELEDLEAPAESQEQVAGGCGMAGATCRVTEEQS